MAKATTHPTCTPTNLNIRTRFSTLYANAPILLASILLNFRRRPESHLQLQVSEKSGVRRSTQRANAREDCRRNSRSAGSRGKIALRGGASEVEAGLILARRARAL